MESPGRRTTAAPADADAVDAVVAAAEALLEAKDDGMETAVEWDALRRAVEQRRRSAANQ